VTSSFFSKIKPLLIVVIAIVIAVGLFLNKPQPKQTAVIKTLPLINVAQAIRQDLQISVRSQGTVKPKTATKLTSEVSGRIIEVSENFLVGAFVNKGDILIRIDQRNYLVEVERAQAAVTSARSSLATEQGRAEVAYKDWLKYNKSVKRSKAAEDLALHKPQLADAKAKVNSALANLDHAKNQLDRTLIRAPYDGIIKSKLVDIGQYVNTGTALADTFSIAVAELRLSIPEGKLNYLNLPTLANSELKSQPSVRLLAQIGGQLQDWHAKLVRTEAVFDERSRVLFTVAEIQDPYALLDDREPLRMGTFVDAQIQGKLFKDLIVLPRHILRTGNRVWVLDDEKRLQNRQVSILRTGGEHMYVTSGLSEGELICLSNISGTLAGKGVRVASTIRTDQQNQPATPEASPGAKPSKTVEPTMVQQLPSPLSPEVSASNVSAAARNQDQKI